MIIAGADENPSVFYSGRRPLRARHWSQPKLGACVGVEREQTAVVDRDIKSPVSNGWRRIRSAWMNDVPDYLPVGCVQRADAAISERYIYAATLQRAGEETMLASGPV